MTGDLTHSETKPHPNNRDGEDNTQQNKPFRLNKCWRYNEADYSALWAPHFIVIASNYFELIAPRREVCVEGLTTSSRILPFLIYSVQLVAESHSFCDRKARRCVCNLKIRNVLGKCYGIGRVIYLSISSDRANNDRRRDGIVQLAERIQPYRAIHRCGPDSTIRCLDQRWNWPQRGHCP